MEALHLPDNIKVHWAGCEVMNQYIFIQRLGVRYGLYTCFPFVERMVFKEGRSQIMPLREMKNPAIEIPRVVTNDMRHTIQDSGLFTLMFGARKGKKDEALINKWYDALVEFTLNHGMNCTCVEVDCQKVLGVDKAWEFRERIKHDLPNNRIINVFHLEDGQDGLDRLIEYSDYIAISVPELRHAGKKNYTYTLARYIKERKPSIDIHLLGCTELDLLRKCNFCTSADSTTWTCHKRYGFIKGHHVSNISTAKVREMIGDENYDYFRKYVQEMGCNTVALATMLLKKDYERVAGNQDYISI